MKSTLHMDIIEIAHKPQLNLKIRRILQIQNPSLLSIDGKNTFFETTKGEINNDLSNQTLFLETQTKMFWGHYREITGGSQTE